MFKPHTYFRLDSAELRQQTAEDYNGTSRLITQIGDLLSALKKSGKLDTTITVTNISCAIVLCHRWGS